MKAIEVKSYFLGIFYNPFRKISFDFNGCGSINLREGLLNTTSCSSDLLNITFVERSTHGLQELFGLGTITFGVERGSEKKIFELPNIKKSKLVEKILNAHKYELLQEQLEEVHYIHKI